MSSLSKMQIRGIRSFSPDRDETIEFYSPLTMIVGANGCGKTTIIESLKFSCTGSMPPNTKSGHLFVNDPAMTDATEVKAHIKLRFQNRSDQTCVAVRSLQVTKKRSKMEFKALEGVLRTTNNQGEKVSISLKCSDMDRVFPENLGVSPAILENVIFCHQEESNWPMQEGIVLKKKFDDVFESTRYTKALEAYSKAKKEFQAKAKDLKGELMEFGAHLLAANQAKDDLRACEDNQEMCNEELTKIGERLERNEAQLRACRDILDAAKGAEAELQKIQLLITEAERRVFDKAQSLESKLDGTDEEIKVAIANFTKDVEARTAELRSMEEAGDNLQMEVAILRSELDQLNIAKGQAVLLQDQSTKLKEEQITMSRSLQRKYNLPLPATNWTPTSAKDYTQHIRNELTKTQKEAAEMMAAARRTVESADKHHNDVKSAVQKLDVELNLKTEEAHTLMSEADYKRSEITKLSSSRNTIQQCQLDFEEAQQSHDTFMETYNLKSNDLKRTIKDATDQIRNLQDAIAEDANTLQEMSLHRNEIANLEASLKQIDIESSQITLDLSGVVRVHREAMAEFGGDANKDCNELGKLMVKMQDKAKQHQRDHATSRDELNQLRSKLAANEALLEQEQNRAQALYARLEKLSSKERSINPCVDQLNELRSSKVFAESKLPKISYAEANINDLVEIAKQTMDEAHELLIIAKSGQIFMKRFKKSRAKNNGDCPCCKQSMSPIIAEGYEQTLKTLFLIGNEAAQCSVEEHSSTFDACLAFHKSIQELQSTLQPLTDVREEIKVADVKVVELNQNSSTIRDQIQALEKLVRERDQKCTSFGKIVQDLNDINVRWESVSKRKSEFLDKRRRQSQTLMTQGDSGGRSMAEMEQDQRNRMEQKDELQTKKDRLMNEDSTLQKRLFSIKNMLSEREKALSDAKIEGNRYSELETALNTLQTKLSDFESRKSVLVSEKAVLSKQVSDAASVLGKAKADLQQANELWDGKVSVIKSDFDSFSKLVEGFDECERKYQELDLANVTLNFNKLQSQVNAKEEERETLFPKMNAFNAELTSQEHVKRNMHANLELRGYEQELKGLKQQLSNLEKANNSSSAKLKQTDKEFQTFSKEAQGLCSERDTLRGKLEVHNHQVAELKAKLNNSTYKGIEEKHRRKNIEFETTNLAVQDIESYSAALDKALQNFHTLKIKEINRIIRELWQLIYKGQDIDMIELESGSDDTTASAKGSKSYNYRVVMKKGDVPLDMRGRCSAGQKVLAAIVIRLALAETFCLNCGMLALDEPTTNLDEPNKLGLAHALSKIIVGRSKQTNFQLICITHDEEFVKMMSDELSVTADFNMPEYYFRVYRQEEGQTGKFFSHIERVPWEDM